jgi:hypothetical protein
MDSTNSIRYIKYYGVYKLGENKYRVINGARLTKLTKSGCFISALSGVYKNPDFAMKKAKNFVESMYKPFTNFQNKKVSFIFVNIGIIEDDKTS